MEGQARSSTTTNPIQWDTHLGRIHRERGDKLTRQPSSKKAGGGVERRDYPSISGGQTADPFPIPHFQSQCHSHPPVPSPCSTFINCRRRDERLTCLMRKSREWRSEGRDLDRYTEGNGLEILFFYRRFKV